MKLFGMPDFAVILDENEAERLTRVISADRILRRARRNGASANGCGCPPSLRSEA